ncbi:MAG: 4-hydroxythreonine-4-phosphate dehydrogenase [Deltaproteobacteria bacterium]|jgi:4-hydroxythreonine-4-phosphate dehydrogenase|nr:MAG: 4-hydroxythreonine-4-phosphate dehydrogenase [Deltaproteobacteria bacterium]
MIPAIWGSFMQNRLTIGITMGDPNGIGAEIIVKALARSELRELCDFLVFGSKEVMEEAEKLVGLKPTYRVVNIGTFGRRDLNPGFPDRRAGEASFLYIKEATISAMEGKVDAVVTAPISKESMHLAGIKYPGHTEILQELTGAKKVAMMFEGGNFRVVLVTIHCALSEVPKLISRERVLSTIEIANESLRDLFGIPEPKIVVSALNPHAGEAGAFGNEEILYIAPAVQMAREKGIDVEGPMPADTLFFYALQGNWDVVVAMYHDQGLIPFKMLYFYEGVNVTLGLPIIRTSPDHGVAYNIAWKGSADPSSMIAAIRLAYNLAKKRKSFSLG